MSDERLRQLERRFEQTQSSEDALELIAAKRRAGLLKTGKPPIGSKVLAIKGMHKNLVAAVVKGPKLGMSLMVGGDFSGGVTLDLGDSPKLICLKFDESVKGGCWSSGVFRYSLHKVQQI